MQGQGWFEATRLVWIELLTHETPSTASHFKNAAPEDIPYAKKSARIYLD